MTDQIQAAADAVKADADAFKARIDATLSQGSAFETKQAGWIARHSRQVFIGAVALFLALVIVLFLSACSSSPIPEASAQPPGDVLNWANPTARTDGSALTDLTSILIQWGAKGGPYTAGSTTVPESAAAPITTVTIPRAPTAGTVCYVAFAVDSAGVPSAATPEACVTVVGKPNPPSAFTAK